MSVQEYENLAQQLNRIEKMTLLGVKKALTVSEVALFTGLSENNIYRLTSERKIPFYKPRGGKIYFDKPEIEEWLLQNKISTNSEIDSSASLYTVINK